MIKERKKRRKGKILTHDTSVVSSYDPERNAIVLLTRVHYIVAYRCICAMCIMGCRYGANGVL